jgi:dephospho-CoA kinase
MHVFGLTGGVASGKSLVESYFREFGTPVVDADELARAAVAPGTATLTAIAQRFGADLLGPDGQLERKALAERVFGDAAAVQALNALVHPRVAALFVEQRAAFENEGHRLLCYSAALLFENNNPGNFRPVVLVAASVAQQLARAQARNGWSHEQTRARIAAQLPLDQKRALADFVIDNGGTLESTREQARDVLAVIRERFG